MRRKTVLFLLWCPLLLTALAARAEACSCSGGGSPCQMYGGAAAVFVGTATDSRTNKPRSVEAARAEPDWTPVVFKFAVLQPFLGVEATEVEVATGHGGGDCGYEFRKGETYLVYASRRGEGGPLVTGICTRTRPVSDAAEDFEFLRALGARGPGVSIDITVTRARHRVKTGDSARVGGYEGARLAVEGAGESREVRTDAEGRARLSKLKPGTYKVRLALPEGLTTYKEEQEVTVTDRGCASVFYGVKDDGRVSGKVSDAEGRVAAGVLVTLVEADDPDPERHYAVSERTGEDGRYELKGLPPGRYLLAVNLHRYPRPDDPSSAYPRTYYPGVAQASQAEAVTLGAGERVKDVDILLPTRRAESVVSGVVVWDDGRPVANARVSFRDVTYQGPGINYGLPPADAEGRFTLKGYRGQTIIIVVGSDREFAGDFNRDGPMERVEPLRITLAEPTETVRIVITKLR